MQFPLFRLSTSGSPNHVGVTKSRRGHQLLGCGMTASRLARMNHKTKSLFLLILSQQLGSFLGPYGVETPMGELELPHRKTL